ncbi:MAG: hypothetical protein KDK91_19775 [Gammaproteobacteria bacterium]|nr:hypothetical protein [Gammaproteobacteria bacterium]
MTHAEIAELAHVPFEPGLFESDDDSDVCLQSLVEQLRSRPETIETTLEEVVAAVYDSATEADSPELLAATVASLLQHARSRCQGRYSGSRLLALDDDSWQTEAIRVA